MLCLNPTLPGQPRCLHLHYSKRRLRMRPSRKRVQLCCCKLKSYSARAGVFFLLVLFFLAGCHAYILSFGPGVMSGVEQRLW